jgi:hypothetical protein
MGCITTYPVHSGFVILTIMLGKWKLKKLLLFILSSDSP